MIEEKVMKSTYTDNIVCPYCGYEFDDCWEYEDGEQVDCNYCDEMFNLEVYTRVTYTTSKIKCQESCKFILNTDSSLGGYWQHNDKNYTEYVCEKCYHQKILTGELKKEKYIIPLTN